MKIAAVIPAKKTSRRLPGKNLATLGDKTLLTHKIDQLKHARRIHEIYVASDCPNTLDIARMHGAIPVHRDAQHVDEVNCPLRDRWRDIVEHVDADLIVWAHVTNPLITPGIYSSAIHRYEAEALAGRADSLASVTMIRRHAWSYGQPLNFDPNAERHPFASELEPFYFQDGGIFIQTRLDMLENGYFYGQRPHLYPIPFPFGLDIDTQRDLDIARILYESGICEWRTESTTP